MSTALSDAPKRDVETSSSASSASSVVAEATTPRADATGVGSTAPARPAPLSYGYKEPWTSKVNFRMLAFAGVLLLLIGYPIYVYFDSVVSGGIHDVGGGYKEVDLKAMSVFPFDQINGTIDDVPQKWRALDGKKVVVYGELWAEQSAGDNLTGFQLCYSIAKCCFSGPPQVQHFVDSRVTPGKEVQYYPNQVKVTGTLHVHVKRNDQKVTSVYQMDVDSVDPA
jgi:hypothetical protein